MDNILDILEALDVAIDDDIDDIEYIEEIDYNKWLLEV